MCKGFDFNKDSRTLLDRANSECLVPVHLEGDTVEERLDNFMGMKNSLSQILNAEGACCPDHNGFDFNKDAKDLIDRTVREEYVQVKVEGTTRAERVAKLVTIQDSLSQNLHTQDGLDEFKAIDKQQGGSRLEQHDREIAARAVEIVGDKLIGIVRKGDISELAQKILNGEIDIYQDFKGIK